MEISANYRPYTGIGARTTPEPILSLMTEISLKMSLLGYTLRSGGAKGADQAFEKSAVLKEIYLPWRGFEGNISPLYDTPLKAFQIASELRPEWHKYSDGVQKLHARNVLQILGKNPDNPVLSKVVICWTPEGLPVGGTSLGVQLATKLGIPVYNLFFKEQREKVLSNLKIPLEQFILETPLPIFDI